MAEPFAYQSDVQLMRLVQAGRDDAFDELVRRYHTPLFRVAESRLGRRDWAEDVVQEALLAAFKSRMTFDISASFRPWLWTILFNQCTRHFQRRSRLPRVESWSNTSTAPAEIELHESSLASREPTPPAVLMAAQRRAELERLLGELSAVQADALRLRFYGGLKFKEIADTMGCSLPTAKNRVRWGLLRMAELMAVPSEPDPPAAESGE